MNKSPKISVIVPVYNVENYIKRSIQSLLDQTYTNFEALIVDDGSKDRSIDIAKKLVKDDERFLFFIKENGGLSDARNFGLGKASGKYISFLDSDDYFDRFFFEKMIYKLINDNSDVCICDIDLVKEDGSFISSRKTFYDKKISGVDAFIDNLQTISIVSMAQNKLYKKELFKEIRYPKGLYYEDRATTYKLFLKSNSVSFINQSLFFYVQRKGSIMNGLNQKKIDDRFIVIDSIKKYLQENNIYKTYDREFKNCYLLNVPLAGASMIAMYSNDYKVEIKNFLNKTDNKIYSLKNIILLGKIHKLKALALLLLKLQPILFKKLLVKFKSRNF